MSKTIKTGRLYKDLDGSYYAVLHDAELDQFIVRFEGDGTAKIEGKDYKHLHLTPKTLSEIQKLTADAEALLAEEEN